MKNIKKEMVYIDEEDFPHRRGYSLATVYNIEKNKYKLYNFGFCPSINDYYLNENVHLPRKLRKEISRLEVSEYNNFTIENIYGIIKQDEVYEKLGLTTQEIEITKKVKTKKI